MPVFADFSVMLVAAVIFSIMEIKSKKIFMVAFEPYCKV